MSGVPTKGPKRADEDSPSTPAASCSITEEQLRMSDGPDYPKVTELVSIDELPRHLPDHLFFTPSADGAADPTSKTSAVFRPYKRLRKHSDTHSLDK